jgi:hypothetical protein
MKPPPSQRRTRPASNRKEPKMAANDTPKNADFIQKIVSDAKNPPQTRTLTGWFGDAGTKGSRRLYTDAQLSSYVDIPADAILHSEPVKDSQPPGAVMVWVKADAQLDSSSASSRASRFLQGDLTKDLLGEGALDRGGFRCVTQPPCAEPTGFTGLCTKQPDVGGCWPCITAIPHCAEPTGFTGKCTHVPWPLPTHYAHCTVLHCPTFDLTCIPQICNVIASGIPGCGGGSPIEQGGGPQQKVGAAADAARIPRTELLGCGFTKEWGLCQTQLLHCQQSIINICITRTEVGPGCPFTFPVDVAAQPGGLPLTAGCPSVRFICRTNLCAHPTPKALTQPPQCPILSTANACPSSFGCPPGGGGDPFGGGGAAQAAFGAADAAQRQALTPLCNPSLQFLCQSPVAQCNPSAIDLCPTRINCDTKAPTSFCTQIAQACPTQFQLPCPTACGPNCQTQQNGCTKLHVCPPPPSPGVNCHSVIALCTNEPACINVAQPAAVGAFPPSLGFACTLPNFCPTIFQPECQQQLQQQQVGMMNPTRTVCHAEGCGHQFGAGLAPQPPMPPTPNCTAPHIGCSFLCAQAGPDVQQQQFGAMAQPQFGISQFTCPTPATRCFFCPPPTFDFNCQFQAQQQFGAAAVSSFNCPTPATHCRVCNPIELAQQQQVGPQAQPAIGISQFTCPTPATRCFICPPATFDFNCQFQAQGRLSIMCPAAPITDSTRFPCGNTNCICNA